MRKLYPLPIFGDRQSITPNTLMPIRLFYWEEGVNLTFGQPATKAQLQRAIEVSAGRPLPNDFLPALDPGDVVILADGIFWVDSQWHLIPL